MAYDTPTALIPSMQSTIHTPYIYPRTPFTTITPLDYPNSPSDSSHADHTHQPHQVPPLWKRQIPTTNNRNQTTVRPIVSRREL
ncbi:hypothetical protein BU24DRAFT_418739, partial [Aaosphaeria arxii CBS 175.79]